MRTSSRKRILIAVMLVLSLAPTAFAQTTADHGAAFDSQPRVGSDLKTVIRNIGGDEKRIWTAPAHLKWRDAEWLVPFAGVNAGLIASDRDVANTVAKHPNWQSRSLTLSNAGLALAAGSAGGFYLLGRWTGDSHKRETGLLAGEAMIDAFTVFEPLKFAAGRERPFVTTEGDFFDRGSSFPSGHATIAFSAATVIAHEYPGPLTQVLAYGGATAVAVSRVTAQQHFPSDVVVGGALGYLIGRSVYHNHHDHDLPGAEWGTFDSSDEPPVKRGTPYVPIDSWVYPLFDRLAAMGVIESGLTTLRPWTRRECARLVEEGQSVLEASDTNAADATKIVETLATEFSREIENNNAPSASVEQLYFRTQTIAGPILRDGFHFGQTITNDFGRPFGEGWNGTLGFSARADGGPFAVYLRAEGEHGAATPGISDGTAANIRGSDGLQQPYPTGGTPSVDRLRLLDAYVGFSAGDWQITAGTQSLWWGPSQGGPLLFSNNAEPIPMVRISRVEPFRMPSFLSWMGPVRTELFVGRLAGQRFIFSAPTSFGPDLPKQPFIDGVKMSFKPTRNLEFSVSYTNLFGGPGLPFTARNFVRTFIGGASAASGQAGDFRDGRSGFDFSYRIPKLRRWLVFYNEAFAEDWISPLANPRRSAMHPGIYMPRLPKLPKLDIRVEGVYTDIPSVREVGLFYTNGRFLSGYTNGGDLIGNWVGREGRGIQGWANYWISPERRFTTEYREQVVDREFLGGGRLQDFSVGADWTLRKRLGVAPSVQYERWNFPLLATTQQSNVIVTLAFSWKPQRSTRKQ